MPVEIRDLMRGTTINEFRSDVQIGHYRSRANFELLKQYIFTAIAPRGKKSSVELLRLFCDALTPGVRVNRYAVIATYGHGKSHFALSLANFFGKPFHSEECSVLFESLSHAIPDADRPIYGHLEAFKRQHQPLLVLILRGDEPSDLNTKFFRAVKDALASDFNESEQPALPFWFSGAQRFIERIPPEREAEANAYLARHQFDLKSLLAAVRDGQARTYEICIGLHEELNGTRPDFEMGIGLKEATRWLVDNLCGPNKPYSGLLVLFDEFSAFVRSYCSSQLPGTPLQDLLNGVADAQERALFIAFAQHDSVEIARLSARGESLDDVLKELDRIPSSSRLLLHSSLEEVLESYLRKKEDVWLDLLQGPFVGKLDEATSITLQVFRRRYLDELKWSTEHFRQAVGVGCYPLHPLTTTVLCSAELRAPTTTRSLLGFVHKEIEGKSRERVETSDGPNWIRATALVDFFREMLGTEEQWSRYQDALSGLSIADDQVGATILKAMYVQTCGQLPVSSAGYAKIVAELAGLSTDQAAQHLESLRRSGIIRQDPVTGTYTFWPVGPGRDGERLIKQKVDRVRLDAQTLENQKDVLSRMGLDSLRTTVTWGHSDDWCFEQVLIERARATKEYLSGASKRYFRWALDSNSREKSRGLVVWMIATDDGEVQWYRDNLPGLLDDVCGNSATPLLAMRPTVPSLDLVERLKRLIALSSFSTQEKSRVGTDWHTAMVRQAESDLHEALSAYRSSCIPEVPSVFRARLTSARIHVLTEAAAEVIAMAYSQGPRRWYTQYKLSQTKFSNAVGSCCLLLLQAKAIDRSWFTNRQMERDIVDLYLRTNWHVVDVACRAAIPATGSDLQIAWSFLDRCFKPATAAQRAGPILESFLNPPFGFDWNTLALLFSTWCAYNAPDLTVDGHQYSGPSGDFASLKPRELLQKVAQWNVARRDPNERRDEVETFVRDIEMDKSRTISQARANLLRLNEFVKSEQKDTALRDRAQQAVNVLQADLQRANDYDVEAARILQSVERPVNLQEKLQYLKAVGSLPSLRLVVPEQPVVHIVRERVLDYVDREVNGLCKKHSALSKLEDYSRQESQLKAVREHVRRAGLTSHVVQVDEAIKQLEQAKFDLQERDRRQAEARDQERTLQALSSDVRLSQLRRGLTTIEMMTPQEKLRQLWEQKRKALSTELHRLEGFVACLDERLGQSADLRQVNALRDETLRYQGLCDEDGASGQIQEALIQCDVLTRYFADLDRLRHNSRLTPEDYARDQAAIQELLRANAEKLSTSQQQVGEGALAALSAALAADRKRAGDRLEQLRNESERGGDPQKILRMIAQAGATWPFLTDSEENGLATLRRRVQDGVDELRIEQTKKAELEARLREQQVAIQTLSAKGPISVLRANLLRIDDIEPLPGMETLWQQKRSTICQELDRLGRIGLSLMTRLDQAIDRRGVDQCRDAALREQSACDEGEARIALDAVLSRCSPLGDYFDELGKLQQRQRQSPADFEIVIGEVGNLVNDRGWPLSEQQRVVARQVCAALQAELNGRRRAAAERLNGLDQELARGTPPTKIQQELGRGRSDWAFLLEQQGKRLVELANEVQSRIDADELQQVELHFRKISDGRQRRECLERLGQLLEELE